MAQFRHVHSRVIDGRRHVWNVERLWELAARLPVGEVAVADIAEVEQDCWFCGRLPTIRTVAAHCRRIMAADLSLPIILDADGALMDGGHRVARALIEGMERLPAVRFDTLPPADVVEAGMTAAPMAIEMREEPMAALAEYARVPIAFEVRQVLDLVVQGGGLGGFALSERTLDAPYVKDYDAIEAEGPARWAERFDLSKWGLLVARAAGTCVGGAVVAFDTAGLDMLEGRRDLAVLWDIRVAPEARGQGVGSALFHAAEVWAAARGCRQLKVETQNVNVPACRFYARMGCVLGAIHRFAYPTLPDEVQLLWYKDLPTAADANGA